jgi:hypothetical protein
MMYRRSFVQTLGAGALLPFLAGPLPWWLSGEAVASLPFDERWRAWIKENDRRVTDLLNRQQKGYDHPHFGGIPNNVGIYTPGGAAHFIKHLAAAYVSADSEHHQKRNLLVAMTAAARHLLNLQYDDGTIDLHSTNFHSTPDTAFVVEPLCQAYAILPGDDKTLLDYLERFLLRAGEALSVGGIHTPNHRWVVSMALARINALFPNPRYLKRIDQWLHEKIDIDPDGQFTEKSTHVYSPLTDRCLITVARLLDRPELYEPVRRNLKMTLYYVHPNGEVVTEASGRQDRYTIGAMDPYYYAYRYMALLDGDPQFSAMARWIEGSATPESLSGQMAYFIEDTSLKNALPAAGTLPEDYFRHFPYSDLVRIRRGAVDATILSDNTTLFTFFHQNAALQAVRLASAFFGKGQFAADHLQIVDGAVILRQELEGPYYQPYPIDELPSDGDWEKMPRKNRPQSEVQYLRSTVKVEEKQPGKFALTFDIEGTDNVPLAIELGFRPGGELSGVEPVADIEDAWFLKEGTGKYTFEGQSITFGPGHHTHQWTQLRGANPKLNALSVYLTGFTPFRFVLEVGT